MNPTDVERTSLSDSHAIFGALMGRETIERYDVCRRVYVNDWIRRTKIPGKSVETGGWSSSTFRVGEYIERTTAGSSTAGILPLLFDETIWDGPYECLRREDESIDDPSSPVTRGDGKSHNRFPHAIRGGVGGGD
jgi:hypothetical protein